MKRSISIVTALFCVVLLASVAFAQSGSDDETPTPTPAAEEEVQDDATDASAVDTTESNAAPFLTMNLAAGYAMDPFFVSVEGGGTIDASDLGPECTGYVNEAPAVSVDWEGEADFVELFYISDHDPVMVVETPDGEFLCADDANEVLLDPIIELTDPAQGVYNIWIGSFDEGQRFPGILVITARPEINIGTFDLAGLVRRGTVPEDHIEAEELRTGERADLEQAQDEAELAARESGTDTLTADITAEGEFPAFDIELDELICNGFVPTEPSFAFSEDGGADNLRIYFESEQDATLIVLGPDEQLFCNDDAEAGANLNPLIDIPTPPAGDYFVYVGRIGLDQPVDGVLTVTETDSEPAILAPPGGVSSTESD